MTTVKRYLILDEDLDAIGSTDSKEDADMAYGYFDLQSESCTTQYTPEGDDEPDDDEADEES